MRLLRRILILLLFFALAGGIWGAVYVQKKGFDKTWRGLIEDEFAKRSEELTGRPIFIKIKRVTLGPLQGLVAEEVFFFKDPQRQQEIAFIDSVILDLDFTEILSRNLTINSLDVKDASLSLPLSPGKRNSEMLRLDRFSGRLVVTENQIEIVKVKTDLQGIEVTLKGSLHRPVQNPGNAAQNEADLEEQRKQLAELGKWFDTLQTVLQEIDRVEFDQFKRPRIEIEFSGDLADLSGMRASCRLFAENFERESYPVQQLTASMEFDGGKGRATLKELHLRDAKGDLRLWAEWPIEGKEVAFDLDSSVDLKALIISIYPNPKLGEVVFFDPPRLKMEGVLKLDEFENAAFPRLPVEAIGEFSSDRIGSRGAIFDGLEFSFSISKNRYYVRNLRLDHKTGALLANLMFDPALEAEAFRYQSEVKLDPKTFTPFFKSEDTQRFLSRWTFNRNSSIYIAAIGSGPDLNPEHWKSRGLVDLRRLRLNNVRFNRFETNFEFAGWTQTYRNVRIARPEGLLITPEAQYNADKKRWNVTELKWSLDPVEGMRAFSPNLADQMERFHFSERPELVANGTIDSRSNEELGDLRRRHDFRLKFQSAQPASHEIFGHSLPFEHPEGILEVKGGNVHLSDFSAGLFGGTVSANFRTRTVEALATYTASVSIEDVPIKNLSEIYSDVDHPAATGKLTGKMELSGVRGDVRSTDGSGEATIHNGDVFAFPQFESLSELIGNEIPDWDTGDRVAEESTANLKMEDGVLSTENLQSKNSSFDFKGSGQIDCVDKTIRFEASTQSPPPPAPESQSIEFTGEGPLSEPVWKPKTIKAEN